MALDPGSLEKLSELLQANSIGRGNDDDGDDDAPIRSKAAASDKKVVKTGAELAAEAKAKAPKAALVEEVKVTQKQKDPKEIWDEDEVESAAELVDDGAPDDRKLPDYEILYKQKVTSEDVYLNMGFKDSSTSFADAIVVKVQLPGARIADVTLDVTPQRMLVRSSAYKLFLHLPHRVDSALGNAKWDADKQTLSVTLPVVKEDET